jgi:hypothetical protein
MAMTTTSLKEMATMRIRRSRLGLLGTVVALATIAPAAAQADSFGIDTFTTTTSSAQAGGHPDLTTVTTFKTNPDGNPIGRNKDLTVTLPQGFLGNPQNVPVCHMSQFLGNFACDPSTQVGTLVLHFWVNGTPSDFPLNVYHVDTQPGHAASFATVALIPTVMINADIGPGHGYELTTSLRAASEGIPLAGSVLTFWGVPADPSHDADRGGFGPPLPADSPRKPFLTYPANCGSGSLSAGVDVNSWEAPNTHLTATAELPAPTGCDSLSVNPGLNVAPSTSQADAPSGYSVTTTVPQNNDPDALGTPALRTVQVMLPDGVALAPPAADGLALCSETQFGATSDDPATCPDAAKIGKVSISSPLQPKPLSGALYFGAPAAGQPFRIFMVASGPGTLIKLVGTVAPDPSTGRLITVFDNLPQLPFSELTLTFFGGPRAVLANPQSCGTFTAQSSISAWSGQTASPASPFYITGCASPMPFAPSFLAGMTGSQAGGTGALTIQFGRNDGEQGLSSVIVDLPPGLLAHLGTVPTCSDADANAGTCSADSQVGAASVAAGAGDLPLWLSGKTYLTGPYKGAPFGLAVVVPAVAGPLNLGTVVVRQAISVNPDDAHVSVASDAIPTIVGGIPLRLRRLAVTIDRPDFLVNPTNCDPLAITGAVMSTTGTQATVSSPFHASGCDELAFSPKLTMKFTGGKGQTAKGKHPGLVATVTPVAGQANIKSTNVTLPASVALDAKNLPALCSQADAQKRACPQRSAVGSAKVTTPLVNGALSGPVFLVSGGPSGLPSLLAALSGPIDINVHADSAFTGKRIQTKFTGLPDAPLSSFVLTINGGSKGILAATRSLCRKKNNASAVEGAHNGREHRATARVSVTCPKKKPKKNG